MAPDSERSCSGSKATNLPWRESNMQTRELDRTTIAVPNRTDISGTATANEINRGLRSEKQRSQWRIAGLPGLGSLMATGTLTCWAAAARKIWFFRCAIIRRRLNERGGRKNFRIFRCRRWKSRRTIATGIFRTRDRRFERACNAVAQTAGLLYRRLPSRLVL